MRETDEERIVRLKKHEQDLKEQGYKIIVGLDEAGRGPMAGPVAIGAAVMKEDSNLLWVNDSKKVTERRREILYDQILEDSIAATVILVDEKRIDEINILNATKEGASLAIAEIKKQLKEQGLELDLVIADALEGINTHGVKEESIIKGDANCYSISCASILAKVVRDRMMREYDEVYPHYKFAKNKGYGTKEHIDALVEFGPCPIHRRSFIKNYVDV